MCGNRCAFREKVLNREMAGIEAENISSYIACLLQKEWLWSSISRIPLSSDPMEERSRMKQSCAVLTKRSLPYLQSSIWQDVSRCCRSEREHEHLRKLCKRYFTTESWGCEAPSGRKCRQFKFCSACAKGIGCSYEKLIDGSGVYVPRLGIPSRNLWLRRAVFSCPVGFPRALISRVWRDSARSLAGRYWHARLATTGSW